MKHYKDFNYDKVFDSNNAFKLHESEKFYMNSKAMSWLLESKCDEIYSNEKFQKETYDHYSAKLKEMYQNPERLSDKEVMDEILEMAAYILNSVHYNQKFHLKF